MIIYKSNDKFYVKSNAHYTEIELIVKDDDVTFAPTNNRVSTIENAVEINFIEYKNELLNKNRKNDIVMEDEQIEEEVEIKPFKYSSKKKYNK